MHDLMKLVGAKTREMVRITPGQRVRTVGPYSEVMCHMKLAGRPVQVELIEQRFADRVYHSAQVYRDGQPAGAPVTTGEAGIRQDDDGFYLWVDDGPGDADPAKVQRDITDALKAALSV